MRIRTFITSLLLAALPAMSQIPTNAPVVLESVPYDQPMWGREDPFGFSTLSNAAATASAAASTAAVGVALSPRVIALEALTNDIAAAYFLATTNAAQVLALRASSPYWDAAYQAGLSNANAIAVLQGSSPTWDAAFALATTNSSRLGVLEGLQSYWTAAYNLSITNNARLNAIDNLSPSWTAAYYLSQTNAAAITLLQNAVAALPTTTYVDSQDALDRAYSWGLFESLTATTNATVIRFLDRYNPSAKWLEYASNTVYEVSVAPSTTNYHWHIQNLANVTVEAYTYYWNDGDPEVGTIYPINTVANLEGATGRTLTSAGSGGVYPSAERYAANWPTTTGLSVVFNAAGQCTIAFEKTFYNGNQRLAYSWPGLMTVEQGEYYDNAAYAATYGTPTAGFKDGTTSTNEYIFSSFYGICYGAGPEDRYLAGEPGLSIRVSRQDTITPVTTNRTAMLSFTNGMWTAINTRVLTSTFDSATNSITQAVIYTNATTVGMIVGATNALTLATTNFVPYSGANKNVDLGSVSLFAPTISVPFPLLLNGFTVIDTYGQKMLSIGSLWLTGTQYNIGDTVNDGLGTVYSCVTPHVSGNFFDDANLGYWGYGFSKESIDWGNRRLQTPDVYTSGAPHTQLDWSVLGRLNAGTNAFIAGPATHSGDIVLTGEGQSYALEMQASTAGSTGRLWFSTGENAGFMGRIDGVVGNITLATNQQSAGYVLKSSGGGQGMGYWEALEDWITAPTGTNIALAVVAPYTNGATLGATALQSEEDTLESVASRGGFAGTETISPLSISIGGDFSGAGRMVLGSGVDVADINASAIGASQNGFGIGLMTIGDAANGANQSGMSVGSMIIGDYAFGASQRGSVGDTATAVNNGAGAMQLFDLAGGQVAQTTADGKASILLGAGVSSNRNAIVAGDGNVSHGDGSVTANSFHADTFHPSTNYTPTGLEPIGACYWDTASETYVIVYPNGQKLNVGEECIFAIQNDTGATITNGMTVMYGGAIGNSGNVKGVPAYVTPTTDVHQIYGTATTDIPTGQSGKVTTRGKVRGIQTNGANVSETWTNTTEIYVTTNPARAGFCSSVKPQAPYPAVRMGVVTAAHANNGTIDVSMQYPQRLADLADVNGTPLTATGQIPVWDAVRGVFDFNYNYVLGTNLIWSSLSPVVAGIAAQKEPTGFDDPSAVTVTYDSTARTITLTQTDGVKIWWRGTLITLASPWTSVAHTDSAAKYYLAMRDSTNAVWSSDMWTFDMAQIAYVNYTSATDALGFRETHGLMGWQTHQAEHRNVGTYRVSGLTPITGTYGIQFDVNASNTPSFNAGVIQDEDNPTTIAEWTQDSYTLLSFTNATSTAVFHTNQANLLLIGTTYPLVNTTASTFTETVSSRFLNVYQLLIPATSDAHSQLYRTVFIQPQTAHTSLAAAQAEDFRSLNLGTLTTFGPEFVAFAKITFRTAASYTSTGKMRIESIGYLSGSQASQTVITQLTAIDHNSTLNRDSADAHPTSAITGLDSALSNSIPYKPFTGTITPANGTATVTYAVGNMPSLTLTGATVITLDPTSYGTSGVSRVALSLYCGTNSVTLSTNVIKYATTPTLSTNSWNTILIRRVANDSWKGVQL